MNGTHPVPSSPSSSSELIAKNAENLVDLVMMPRMSPTMMTSSVEVASGSLLQNQCEATAEDGKVRAKTKPPPPRPPPEPARRQTVSSPPPGPGTSRRFPPPTGLPSPRPASNSGEAIKEAGLSLLFEASVLQQERAKEEEEEDPTTPSTAAARQVSASSSSGSNGMKGPQGVVASSRTADSWRAGDDAAAPAAAAAAAVTTAGTILPTDMDVLCGRGGAVNKHTGNIIYRRVVEYNKAIYRRVPKRHRMLVSQSIVQTILGAGGRFLQRSSDETWGEVPARRAVSKTSQALRERSGDDGGTATATSSLAARPPRQQVSTVVQHFQGVDSASA